MGAAAAYVRRVDHPHFKAMFDTFHANIEEVDLPKAFSQNAAEIAHIHICNNDRGIPGRGHIDFQPIFQAIKSSRYQGWLTIRGVRQGASGVGGADPCMARFLRPPRRRGHRRVSIYPRNLGKGVQRSRRESVGA